MSKYILLSVFISSFFSSYLYAQPDRWQQKVKYTMEVELDVQTHQFKGTQKLDYTNNSPDTLHRVFYHLYFNAFQPGSMMDIRSRSIADPDGRVGDRIAFLSENEIGFQKINSLKKNGKALDYKTVGTVLEVTLSEPILPKSTVTFDMEFEGQVPVQIRRSGRNNKEGIAYSMTQWYPKMAEYDYQGWHANPYIGREFHGVWGDFDVKLTLDKSYVVASSGYIQNPQEVGHGYEAAGKKVKQPKGDKLTWHFIAPNVHDFAWAADPDYVHKRVSVPNGPELHFFYQEGKDTEYWEQLPEYVVKTVQLMNKDFGVYPYKVYNVVQGGDGGMEYAMLTLITGHRKLGSLVGVTVHELVHSWYQMVLATNESLYAWMDEGFNTYASTRVMKELFPNDKKFQRKNLYTDQYNNYFKIVASGKEEPLTTHADHFNFNATYSMSAYTKGAIFLHQLSYIIGQEAFDKGMLEYYNTWKFKHPNTNDFIRVMEKVSGLELDWYKEYFVSTTKTIDYGIKTVISTDDITYVSLEKKGDMIMPIDIEVELKNGKKIQYYAPLRIMRGEKKQEVSGTRFVVEDWPWTYPVYVLAVPFKGSEIKRIEIDPSERMADIDRSNNILRISDYTREN